MEVTEEDNWIIGGDINVHHEVWEKTAWLDSRGEAYFEWAEEMKMMVMNNGEPTLTVQRTKTLSTPDVTLLPRSCTDDYTWTAEELQKGSDHPSSEGGAGEKARSVEVEGC